MSPKHPGTGEHPNVMPPSLRDRRPSLFDGSWRTEVQKERDRLRAQRKAKRREKSEAAEAAARQRSLRVFLRGK